MQPCSRNNRRKNDFRFGGPRVTDRILVGINMLPVASDLVRQDTGPANPSESTQTGYSGRVREGKSRVPKNGRETCRGRSIGFT